MVAFVGPNPTFIPNEWMVLHFSQGSHALAITMALVPELLDAYGTHYLFVPHPRHVTPGDNFHN